MSRYWLLAVLMVGGVGCGGDPDPGPDAGACGSACEDGLFCNGVETCDPEHPDADEDGCVAARPACTGECDEDADECVLTCETDADSDGIVSIECGGSDCDDMDSARFPGATDVCDTRGVDEDCDFCTVGDADSDGDGFNASTCGNIYRGPAPSCGTRVRVLPGEVVGGDCDDTESGVSPNVAEVPCNLIDDDCDGAVDEGGRIPYWPDSDMDGYGNPNGTPREDCSRPPGYSDDNLDCDDSRSSVNPARGEDCDGLDNNCNGDTDEGFARITYYRDVDGDDYGVMGDSIEACMEPAGYAPQRGLYDCDDSTATVNPGRAESCNAVDDDCNGLRDFAIAGSGGEDDDLDGYPDIACPGGGGTDCDDARADVFPSAAELCDGRNNDCDGSTDEGSGPDVHCGGAPNVVPASATCTGAAACSATCATGFDDCDNVSTPTNGCEVDLRITAAHCGACGFACGTSLVCSESACRTETGPQRIATAYEPTFRLSGSHGFTCVIRAGAVHCWGRFRQTATPVAGIVGAVEIRGNLVVTSAGRAYRIEASADGTYLATDLGRTDVRHGVAAWDGSSGWNHYVLTTAGALVQIGTMTRTITNVTTAIQLGSSGAQVCALLATGSRVCWSSHTSATPTLTTTVAPFRWLDDKGCGLRPTGEMVCGSTVTGYTGGAQGSERCAVTGAGEVLCVGANGSGEVGDGTTTNRSSPVAVVGLDDAVQVASGPTWACALDASDDVSCWGSFYFTGGGTSPIRATAVEVPLTGITHISPSNFVTAGGRVYHISSTVIESGADGATDVLSLAAGGVCHRTTGGGVRCQGGDDQGQLGNGEPRTSSSGWVNVSGLGSGVTTLVGSSNARGALTSGGTVYRWGSREFGSSCCDGVAAPESIITGAQQLVEAYDVACARVSGSASCWGRVNDPMNGISYTTTPITLTMPTGITDLALRSGGGVAIVGGGAVVTWGNDGAGLLGNGPGSAAGVVTIPGLTATRVFGDPSGVTETVCALRTDNRLVCWGLNRQGEVGDGTSAPRESPTLVTALPAGLTIQDVVLGNGGACALLAGGTARCWGHGDFGVPHAVRTTTPVAVLGLP